MNLPSLFGSDVLTTMTHYRQKVIRDKGLETAFPHYMGPAPRLVETTRHPPPLSRSAPLRMDALEYLCVSTFLREAPFPVSLRL